MDQRAASQPNVESVIDAARTLARQLALLPPDEATRVLGDFLRELPHHTVTVQVAS